MLNKIAFLCTDPWEKFLPVTVQSHSREYFQWICQQAVLQNINIDCQELIEIYGENMRLKESGIFAKSDASLQLLYVQSRRLVLIEKVFEKSDLVVMGLPGCRKEFEKMLAAVFPWRHQMMFLWDRQHCRGEQFVKALCREYRLRETQMMKIPIKKAPIC